MPPTLSVSSGSGTTGGRSRKTSPSHCFTPCSWPPSWLLASGGVFDGANKNRGGRSRPGNHNTVTSSGNFHCVSFRHPDLWKRDFKDSFFKFGVDAFTVHFNWQGNRSHEFAVAKFMPIEVFRFVFFLELPLGLNHQAVACDRDLDVIFLNAG